MNDEVVRGAEAARLLDSKIFKDAAQSVRDGIIAQMSKVAIKDVEMHSKLIITLQLWAALEKHIQNIATTGKMVQFQIDQEEKQSKILEMFRFGR